MRKSEKNVSLISIALMLAIVFLSLFNAGFDNILVYLVVMLILIVNVYLIYKCQISYNFNYKAPLFWYSLFLFWAGVSIFWSINPHRTLVEFIQMFLYGLVFLFASNLDDSNMIRILRITLITAVGISLFGLSQYLFLDSSRIVSTIGNANSLGIYLTMVLLVGWSYYLRKPWRFGYIFCIILFNTLVLTISRGSLISLAISLPFIFLGFGRNIELRIAIFKTLLFLLIGLALSQLFIFISPFVQNFAKDNITLSYVLARDTPLIAWSGISRFAFWETGIRVFLSNPFAGTGLGTFFLAYFTEFADNIWYSRFVHNHYIQIMSELGVIGISLFIAFIITNVVNIWKVIDRGSYPPYCSGVVAAMIAFLIHIGGDFSWNFPGVAILFFLFAGLVTGYSNKCKCIPNLSKKYQITFCMISIILLIIVIWPLTANLLYRKALLLEANNNYNQAINVYDLANSIYPINSMAFNFASNTYYNQFMTEGRTEYLIEALERAKRASELSPVDGNLHNVLGRLYWESGMINEAEKHLLKATDYSAYRIGFYIDLAWFYNQHERYEEAKQVLDRGLELSEFAVGMHPTDQDRERVGEQIEIIKQLQEINNINLNQDLQLKINK